ncbi:HEAT repeat domain-containing protein [Myxococcus landrumensis]|uniref:HEAT repeat domain-containing protein n=1 Tax=Myxococcus landrumensis TaxID=2813577 RepID=A0ABX7NBK7_9BACT|nr:HEAT repeat domain-containing protein [Myxococcus landrumus]QSQ16172.1 HEAT repeat domain-containing protein [Myxococcus landrumus]
MSMSTPPPTSRAIGPRTSSRRGWCLLALGAGLVTSTGGSALALSRTSNEPPAATLPASPSELRAQVLALLDASQGPVREEQWRRLGTQAVPVLSALAMDNSVVPSRRSRAIASLALVDPTQGARSIQEVLDDTHAPVDVRVSAAEALAQCMGVEAIGLLAARLADREAPVREAVALTLGRLGGQQARQVLEERLPVEERPLVREALQRGLTLAEP